jgi:hypothetical protein
MAPRDMLAPKQSTSEPNPLTEAHRDRQALYKAYWKYYRGQHRKALKVRANQPDDNVTLNYSKRAVNKGVQFLFGKPVTFQIDAAAETRTPDELYLDTVWGTDEEKQTLLQKIALNGAVTGTAVVRLYPPEANVPDALPRIVNIDPAILDVLTNPDDIEDVRAYHLVWKSGDDWKRHRIDVQADGTWLTTEEVRASQDRDWRMVAEIPWPYPFAPIVTAQNLPLPNEFWGMSDLEDADINDAINFTASNIARILKFHAHPKTIGTGFAANMLQSTAVDEFWAINVEGAKVANLEMQSDLASSHEFLSTLKTAHAKVTNVPDLDPAVVNVGALSGFALRILYGDLEEVTNVKRNTYGALLAEINKRTLAIGRGVVYGSVVVKNDWKSPLPSNPLEEAQTLEIDVRNGLSKETYLEKRGYDAKKETERKTAEQDAAAEQFGNVGEMHLTAFDRGNGNGQNAFNPRGNNAAPRT